MKAWLATLNPNSVQGFLYSGRRERETDWEEEYPIMRYQ
jgi:hypothetical protein